MNKKQQRNWWIFGIIIVAIIIILIIISGTSAPSTGKTIKIGSILILTGQGSSWGIAEQNAINLAVDKINSEGGIHGKKIVVDFQDDQSDPSKAISAFNYLTDVQNISMIIGPTWSAQALPLINLSIARGTLMISPSVGEARFNEASPLIFNTWPHDVILSGNLADYVYNKGYRNVAVIGAEETWVKEQTNAFVSRFEALGGNVSVVLEPQPDITDVSSEALKIANDKNLDAIVSTTDGVADGPLIAKKVRELGVTLPIFSITISKSDVAASQGAYNGMQFLTFLTYTNAFKQAYAAKYGLSSLDIGAPSAYDAVMLLAQAINETNSMNTTVLADYLSSVKNYSGASLNLTSDGKGGFVKGYAVDEVVNGTIYQLESNGTLISTE